MHVHRFRGALAIGLVVSLQESGLTHLGHYGIGGVGE